jgi:hypothetical protein
VSSPRTQVWSRPGHRDQQVVAGGVAELVVDRLEVVQVDEEQGQGRAGLGAAAQRVTHPLPEQGPVGQVGEPVVERLMLQVADHGRQPAVEGLVVEHGQQLAADDQQHQGHERPVQERPGRLAPQLLERRGGHGQGQGAVGQQELEPPRPPPGPGDPGRRRPPGRRRHQQVAGEPADVGQGPGRVGPLLGEVGEAGVGHGQAEQAGPEQQDRGPADPDPAHDHEHDRGQDHVPDRVGEHDRLLEDAALAGPEHRAEHQRPAGVQQRGGDHGPVQQRPGLEGGPFGPAREGQHGGNGQRDGPQVADVGERREWQLAPGQVLVPDPGGLPDRPAGGRRGQQGPGPAGPAARPRDGRPGAADRGQRRRQQLGQVGGQLDRPVTHRPDRQERQKGQAGPGGQPQAEPEPPVASRLPHLPAPLDRGVAAPRWGSSPHLDRHVGRGDGVDEPA